jgi:hypothetical protein
MTGYDIAIVIIITIFGVALWWELRKPLVHITTTNREHAVTLGTNAWLRTKGEVGNIVLDVKETVSRGWQEGDRVLLTTGNVTSRHYIMAVREFGSTMRIVSLTPLIK